MKINISIVDDHRIVTGGIEHLLSGHDRIAVQGIYHSGRSLLNGLEMQQPDVLLLDIQMPGMAGDELAQLITARHPLIGMLVLTNMDLPFHVRTMFACGVKGYLLKSASLDTLEDAIETVYRGQQYIDESLKDSLAFELVEGRRTGSHPVLTQREKKMIEMIAAEKTSAEIAGELFISLRTVETHRTNLFLKMGVKNAAGMVRKGIQLGLLPVK